MNEARDNMKSPRYDLLHDYLRGTERANERILEELEIIEKMIADGNG